MIKNVILIVTAKAFTESQSSEILSISYDTNNTPSVNQNEKIYIPMIFNFSLLKKVRTIPTKEINEK